jgi:DNA adenine methylase
MKTLPHPIQYQGSKRHLADIILRYFPQKIDCLIEPFAGSAAISIATSARRLAKHYLINDLNKPLAELLKLIVEEPEELSEAYENLWNVRDDEVIGHYYQVREDFNRTQDPKLFLYLLARCVKGSVRYNTDGLFNQSPDKRRRGTKPETMRSNIFGVSRLLKGKAVFSSYDYKDVLSMACDSDLVYMDPPYQGVCGERDSRYFSGINYREFTEQLDKLNARNIPYLVSYDGRRGSKTFGEVLPDSLGLYRVEIEAGRSTQATLLGREEITYESLYLSKGLLRKISIKPEPYDYRQSHICQLKFSEIGSMYAEAI